MPKAPKSYVNHRRPPLIEALEAEGAVNLKEATDSLTDKGYFTSKPRPWKIGFFDRGHGRRNYAVLDRFGDLVAETPNSEDAELIVVAVNTFKP